MSSKTLHEFLPLTCINVGMKFVDVGLYKWWLLQLCIVFEIFEANPVIQSKS